ncbi:hypothetical protein JTE90_018243 [Oedothorax gibbosus]|uniref:Uncharacterized protein n=1 Tax=Oedothorax gibbosus TaxID=931172 RepID=A0AAV6U9F1_9ARAC|nr:hypothetical protein JTE90_018243 [Oedothorax gibbosus]
MKGYPIWCRVSFPELQITTADGSGKSLGTFQDEEGAVVWWAQRSPNYVMSEESGCTKKLETLFGRLPVRVGVSWCMSRLKVLMKSGSAKASCDEARNSPGSRIPLPNQFAGCSLEVFPEH